MFAYFIRRLVLLPITLFCIILVNFLIINLAPGDPVSVTDISPTGQESRREGNFEAFGSDERYLQFREFYGLTLPIVFNAWPWISEHEAAHTLRQLVNKNNTQDGENSLSFKAYEDLRIKFGDQARFIMPPLLKFMSDPTLDLKTRKTAMRFFIRGGTQQGYVGPYLTAEEKLFNRKVANENDFLRVQLPSPLDTLEETNLKVQNLEKWYQENKIIYHYEPTSQEKIFIFFFETRFYRYMSRVLTLNFGTLRDDPNKTVIQEVVKRFKYSLTLALLPMILTFGLCLFLGFAMAVWQNRWIDHFLNTLCLILYAIPVFVVAPFLIEKVALNRDFPFSHIPIPYSGFMSPEAIFQQMNSWQRLWDILQHILLPLVAIIYGSLAAQSRLARTAVLEVLRQDYVRTARAKGLKPLTVLFKHVGRNASITILTSIAGSLGIILGGSLIVETLFEIPGFGKFFYDAVLNRDYNVIMFSALAGSFLTLVGYLAADITYTVLDPRVTLE